MLMKDNDSKKMVTAIVSRAKGPNSDENLRLPESEGLAETEDGVEQDQSIPEQAAAEELIAAIEMKSPAAIVDAIKALLELCK